MSRVLLTCIHYPVAAGRYLLWALRRAGHEVITAGPAVGNFLPWADANMLEPYEWKPDVPLLYDRNPSGDEVMGIDSENLLNRLRVPPDLIIQMDAKFIMQGKAPCPNVLYAIDNHVAPYGSYDTFDRIFIAHSWGYMSELPHAEWLPCGYDPLHHYVIEQRRQRPYDVAMFGNAYPPRIELVKQLRAAGLSVAAGSGLLYREYNQMYNQAKVALVRSVADDVAMRVFENMAQGCVIVSDRTQDMAACGFTEGREYYGYDTAEECVAVVRCVLNNYASETTQTMISRAREAVKPHTWAARARRILEAVGL